MQSLGRMALKAGGLTIPEIILIAGTRVAFGLDIRLELHDGMLRKTEAIRGQTRSATG